MSFPISNGRTEYVSLPPLHPSASMGSLAIKRRSGISKIVTQKLTPTSLLVPIETPQLHNSHSCTDISPVPSDASLASHFSEVSINELNRSTASEEMIEVPRGGGRKRSLSAGVQRGSLLTRRHDSSDNGFLSPETSTPSTSRQAMSLDEGKEDTVTVHSVRSTILPRITNQEARKGMHKGFLLVKNGKTALQDRDELERCFPDGKVTIFVGTWNMAGQDVSSNVLADWLFPENMHTTADIYAVGIQEAVFNPNGFKDWESKLQRCLWSCKHVLFHSASLGVQHLAVFVRRELIWFLSHGPDPNGRIRDYHRIVQSLFWKGFGWRGSQVLDNVDVAFWAGDLNFRLEEKRQAVESLVNSARATFPNNYSVLMERDQLGRELSAGRLFHDFQEQPVRFPPTYKYDLGTSVFDTSAKNRVPAYTDRILYHVKGGDSGKMDDFESVLYDSVPSIKSSDHKPVYGVFRIKVEPGNDHMVTPKFDTAILQAGLARDDGAPMNSKLCVVM